MIPKVIHYCWFGGNPIPADLKNYMKSWEKMCPDYKIIRWDENNFDLECHPFLKSAYEAKAWAFMSDYARLKVVYENGGIYLDTDVELLKSLDFLRKYSCYIGVQQQEHLCATGLGFGAEQYNPVVKLLLDQYDGLTFSKERIGGLICPYLNNKVFESLGYKYSEEKMVIADVLILPPKYFDPVAPGEGNRILKCAETISIHHYSASWMGQKTAYKRSFIRLIGQERIIKIKKALKIIGNKFAI